MTTATMKDGAKSYFEDWGSGPVVIFSQRKPLTAASNDDGDEVILPIDLRLRGIAVRRCTFILSEVEDERAKI